MDLGSPQNSRSGQLKDKQARAEKALAALKSRYPKPATLLRAKSPWELLVATVLAAQCTDARVNQVTPDFFKRWPDPQSLSTADVAQVEEAVRSTGFFRNKAKSLVSTARKIVDLHNGQVPSSLKELVTLDGVARKTANVVLWGAFGQNEGLAVDTHVARISFRLGLTESEDPVRIERDLTALFPQPDWGNVNHMMVWFGREVCPARSPNCPSCEMTDFCPKIGVNK